MSWISRLLGAADAQRSTTRLAREDRAGEAEALQAGDHSPVSYLLTVPETERQERAAERAADREAGG